MHTRVDFTCKLAIGIGGIAVLDLVEHSESDGHVRPGETLHCIRDDIEMEGAIDWVWRAIQDVPDCHGIYTVVGRAIFTWDDVTYSSTIEKV